MSSHAELDIRWPIGLLFLALGAVVAIYGAVTPDRTHVVTPLNNRFLQDIASINLNLVWGVVMLLFGVFMIWSAHRAGRRQEDRRDAETQSAGN